MDSKTIKKFAQGLHLSPDVEAEVVRYISVGLVVAEDYQSGSLIAQAAAVEQAHLVYQQKQAAFEATRRGTAKHIAAANGLVAAYDLLATRSPTLAGEIRAPALRAAQRAITAKRPPKKAAGKPRGPATQPQ